MELPTVVTIEKSSDKPKLKKKARLLKKKAAKQIMRMVVSWDLRRKLWCVTQREIVGVRVELERSINSSMILTLSAH